MVKKIYFYCLLFVRINGLKSYCKMVVFWLKGGVDIGKMVKEKRKGRIEGRIIE